MHTKVEQVYEQSLPQLGQLIRIGPAEGCQDRVGRRRHHRSDQGGGAENHQTAGTQETWLRVVDAAGVGEKLNEDHSG